MMRLGGSVSRVAGSWCYSWRRRAGRDGAPWGQCVRGGGGLVLFVAETGREGLFAPGDLGGLYVVDERVAFYDLTRRHEQTFDLRMRRLYGRDEIVAAVRAAGEFERAGKAVKTAAGVWPWVSLPLRARFGKDVLTEGSTELLLPVDERTEAAAEKWEKSPDPEWRLMAVRAAARVDTKRSRAVVERLMNDPAYVTEEMQGWDPRVDWRRRRIYFVRQAAWEAMVGRPKDGSVVLEGPDLGRYVALPAVVGWGLLIGFLVMLAGSVVVWRARRRWGEGVAALCVALALVIGWLGWRTRNLQVALNLATARSEHEVVLVGGRFHWLRVHDDPGARGVTARAEPAEGSRRPWFEKHLTPSESKGALGVSVSSGKTAKIGRAHV